MMAAATRVNIGSAVTLTTGASIASNAYSATSSRLQNTEGAPVADFTVENVTFAAAPVAGAIRLAIVDRDTSGTQGPTPSASIVPRTYPFDPQPATGNTSTGWVMSCNRVPISPDCDFWLYNAATGQSLNSGAVVTAQRYGYGV